MSDDPETIERLLAKLAAEEEISRVERRAAKDTIERLTAERDEARRRRDEWRKKAEGYDEVRRALREKVGAPWPPHLSRHLWAGIAADEKKRADDAEAERDEALRALREAKTDCGEPDCDGCVRHPAILSKHERKEP